MPRLSQILGVEKGVRNKVHREATALYRKAQMPGIFAGRSRTYAPKDDDDEKFPAENQKVQMKADDILHEARGLFGELLDLVATKEYGNTNAKADVTVNGQAVLTDVPVTYLLFLQKELGEILQLLEHLPTHDPTMTWKFDEGAGIWRTEAVDTSKTKKIPRNHVRTEATDKHPAQVDVYYEDVVMGTWTTILHTGALPPARVEKLVRQTRELRDAVVKAREEANVLEVPDVHVADPVLDYIFA